MSSAQIPFRFVKVFHPHWSGNIRLDSSTNRALLEIANSSGIYRFSGTDLVVDWDNYPEEKFYNFNNEFYISENLTIPQLDKTSVCLIGERMVKISSFGIVIPNYNYEVFLRSGSSDIPTYQQVFEHKEYDSDNLPVSAEYIVDAGGNIGLASIFFALRYPDAKIVAIEPGADNFSMLTKNTHAFGDRVQRFKAALWYEDTSVSLSSEDENGAPLGDWGLKITNHGTHTIVKGMTVQAIMDESVFPRIDILKIDIEGSEFELFSSGCRDWLSKVSYIVIETHDRFKYGSEAAVREALAKDFEELPKKGENLFFRNMTI